MRRGCWFIGVGITVAAVVAGCDERGADRAETTAPSVSSTTRQTTSLDTEPAPTTGPAPQTQTAEQVPPQPTNTFLQLQEDGVERFVIFPPAKLRLKRIPDGLLAVLYTDDPPAAASRDYQGNSYLFNMKLQGVRSPAELDRAQWVYRAEASEAKAVDAADGIFLQGLTRQLQPVNAVATFEVLPSQVIVEIQGEFRSVSSEERAGTPKTVLVQGMIPVILESDEK